MTLAFILSMPNVGSWNGRWSGEQNVYAIVKSFSSKKAQLKAEKMVGHHYYNFGDGWGASVEVRKIDSSEARSLRRRSQGFCGYDWMVRSIIEDGTIYGPTQPKPEAVTA